MNKELLKKIGLAIFTLIIIRLLVIYIFNDVNMNVTDYTNMVGNTILVEELLEGTTKALLLEYNSEDIYTFFIESTCKEGVTFIYEGGEYAYNIYVGDQLRRQNYDGTLNGYTNEIPYGVVDIETDDYKEVDGRSIAVVKLERHDQAKTDPIFFFGTKDVIRKNLALRTMYNTFMATIFFVILIVSSLFYRRDRTKYMLITLLISIISVLKCIISGELPGLNFVLGISIDNFFIFERMTTALNYFLYQSLLYTLYQFKIKKRYIVLYIGLLLFLTAKFAFQGNAIAFFILYSIGVVIMMTMTGIGYIKDKPYERILLTTYSIFGGFNLCNIFIALNYLKQGYISSIVNGSQIGSIIYVLGFLIAVIMTYFNKIEQYEKKQKEYERFFLIRGISHDLKLPLSVIKLNNQMLQKYDMTGEERKSCTKTSLEAVRELEKMTDNINSYLNMESTISEDCATSIKESLEKLKNHYNIYREKNYKFIVQCDDKDCILPIKPLQFDRMIYNLVDNAFKYNKDNGEVKVKYVMDKKATIIVEDNGIGMDQEQLDKICIPLYRIDHSRTKDGLGLGLSIAKGIIDSINGDLKIESKKGVGTKIIITFSKKIQIKL